MGIILKNSTHYLAYRSHYKMNMEEQFMARCLYLANLGKYNVAPNPMVGAVIVHQNRIIGEGYHQKYGEAHAEPNAIKSVKEKDQHLIPNSTLFVNLEPCSHFGKTPPCAELIVRSKIKRVVIATLDPNPQVAGRGVKILEKAGIEVSVGILEKEALELNKRFFTFQLKKRPFITLKWAQTKDRFIDKKRSSYTEKPILISNPITQKLTHKMRAENMAIMVGKNTALLDNPTLTVRNWQGNSPIRLTFDKKDEIPTHFNLKNGEIKTFIFSEKNIAIPNVNSLKIANTFDLHSILKELYKQQIHSILIEGGSTLLHSFICKNLWDEMNIETSNHLIKKGIKAPKTPKKFKKTLEVKIEDNEWLHIENSF